MAKPKLTKKILIDEAKAFAPSQSKLDFPELYGVTDGKAVGTFIEHKFREHLASKYTFLEGSSAKGIDFPDSLIPTRTLQVGSKSTVMASIDLKLLISTRLSFIELHIS